MARLSKDIVVMTKPVRTNPSGDYFYMELSRKNSRYECVVWMSCSSGNSDSVVMAIAQGKTIREAEQNCYRIAVSRCPRFPKPPYFKRGQRIVLVAPAFHNAVTRDTAKKDSSKPEHALKS
jgi:hypothetical protein